MEARTLFLWLVGSEATGGVGVFQMTNYILINLGILARRDNPPPPPKPKATPIYCCYPSFSDKYPLPPLNTCKSQSVLDAQKFQPIPIFLCLSG